MAATATSEPCQTAAAAASQSRYTTTEGIDFEGLVELFYGYVFRLQMHWTEGDKTSAEDITQETFIKAQQAFGGFRGSNNDARRWLSRIAKNRFLDHQKASRRKDNLVAGSLDEPVDVEINWQEPSDPSGSVFDELAEQERSRLIEGMLHALNSGQHDVIVLCDLRGYTQPEAARALNVPVGTVCSRRSRAYAKLRKIAEQLDADDPLFQLL